MPWERRRYRKNKVWVEVDAHGEPLLDERSLVSMRYKPADERTYSVRPDEVRPLVETEAPVEAAPSGPRAPKPEGARDAIHIYTDGASSGNPGPAGLGAVLLWQGRRREIQRYLGEATNNEAELSAVLAGLEAVRRPDLEVVVFTDSTYVIGVLAGGHRPQANLDLVAQIRAEMARFPRLRFEKVPAHAGVPENERADRLATDAIRRSRAE
jgi:ribonuclease HI